MQGYSKSVCASPNNKLTPKKATLSERNDIFTLGSTVITLEGWNYSAYVKMATVIIESYYIRKKTKSQYGLFSVLLSTPSSNQYQIEQ